MFEWVRFVIGTIVLLCGLAFFVIEIYGIYRFHYVLNRMHAAAMGDTMGISISIIGLMIFTGFSFVTLKLALIILFLWFASPVSSHLIARLEVTTNERLGDYCTTKDLYLSAKKSEDIQSMEVPSDDGQAQDRFHARENGREG